jgi:hypothetical protein
MRNDPTAPFSVYEKVTHLVAKVVTILLREKISGKYRQVMFGEWKRDVLFVAGLVNERGRYHGPVSDDGNAAVTT